MNRLSSSTSPYLLQHASNPVDWFPWGAEALEKARLENKLLVISVGYAACHWCHVMEHESFEDDQVAAVMNEHYVSIKVDREERPDIDQIYMDAVQLMTRRGGWPLNCIALPDGRPIYGGTYFPKQQWIQVLTQLAALWENDPGKAKEYAAELTEALRDQDGINKNPGGEAVTVQQLEGLVAKWLMRMDKKEGGEQKEPKFPMPANWKFLHRASHLLPSQEMRQQVYLTLHKMALGGIFDAVGGGFARYSVDGLWHVPHFEKMLYDNTQLISLYSEAWLATKEPLYKRVVYETISFLNRELRDPQGGYYSSLDADSEGVEGKFYTWTLEEIQECLGEEAKWFAEFYHCTAAGNWEHGNNVLIAAMPIEAFGISRNWQQGEAENKLKSALDLLLARRNKRIRPGLDDKIITAWNGLMMRALTDAWLAFGEEQWLEDAKAIWQFVKQNLFVGEQLIRSWRQGRQGNQAFLDDYALLADGLLALFSVTGEMEYLEEAEKLCRYASLHFADGEQALLFYTSDEDAPLIARKKEIMDNVIPSANSAMAHNFYLLGIYTGNEAYSREALEMAGAVKEGLMQYPGAFANYGSLMLQFVYEPWEVVVTGPAALSALRELNQHWHPSRIYLPVVKPLSLPLAEGRFSESRTRIFVCKNRTCSLPSQSVEEALTQMN